VDAKEFWNKKDKRGDDYYFNTSWIPATDTTAKHGIWRAKAYSKRHWKYYFAKGSKYENMKMSDVLKKYAGKLVPKFGSIEAPVAPKPNENASDYTARGGYLLFVDPANGVFTAHRPIVYKATETGTWYVRGTDEIAKDRDGKKLTNSRVRDKIDLFFEYDPLKNRVRYLVKYDGSRFNQLVNDVGKGIMWIPSKIFDGLELLCSGVTQEAVNMAASAAVSYAGPVYGAAWRGTATACGYLFPDCPPQYPSELPPPPPPPPPPLGPLTPAPVSSDIDPDEIAWYDKPGGKTAIAAGATGFALLTAVILLRR
jgi:hypothetical protein